MPKAGPRHLAHMGLSSGKSDSLHVPSSPVDTARLVQPTYIRQVRNGSHFSWPKKTLACTIIKLVFGGPGIVPVTTAEAAR